MDFYVSAIVINSKYVLYMLCSYYSSEELSCIICLKRNGVVSYRICQLTQTWQCYMRLESFLSIELITNKGFLFIRQRGFGHSLWQVLQSVLPQYYWSWYLIPWVVIEDSEPILYICYPNHLMILFSGDSDIIKTMPGDH